MRVSASPDRVVFQSVSRALMTLAMGVFCLVGSAQAASKAAADAPIFNVKDAPYSAKGDGIADDRAAIQRAIDAARNAGGGEVHLPAGTYRVTLAPRIPNESALRRVFTVHPAVRIRGESRDTATIKLADGQGGYGAIFAGATFGADATGFELRSLTVDHNTAGNPVNSAADVAIDPQNFSESKIRAAVWLATGTGMTVQDCRFTDVRAVWTVFLAGNEDRVGNVTVADNVFDEVGGGAVDFDASQVYIENNGALSRIAGNLFVSSNDGAAGSVGLRTAIEVHGDNLLVENNEVYGFLTGLNVGSSYPAAKNYVRGNRFENVNTGVVLWADADALAPPPDVAMREIEISGNAFVLDVGGWQRYSEARDSTFTAVRVEQQGASDRQLQDILIAGNEIRFLNMTGDGHPNGDRYSAGVHYNRAWNSSDNKLTTRLTIRDNIIIDPPGMGIYVNAPVKDGVISGNIIANPGSSVGAQRWPGWQSGIFLQDRLENFRVLNNRFSGAQLKQGIYAINTVVGLNLQTGNTVEGSVAPVFVRGAESGTGNWSTQAPRWMRQIDGKSLQSGDRP